MSTVPVKLPLEDNVQINDIQNSPAPFILNNIRQHRTESAKKFIILLENKRWGFISEANLQDI